MNSNEIFKIIESIAADSSKLAKEAIIKKHSSDEEFKRVLRYAYDNSFMFGIKEIPPYTSKNTHNEDFTVNTWTLLDNLASRRLSGNAALAAVKNELEYLHPDSADLLKRIIKKDLRAGFSESTINKAIPKFIPAIPYMRCSGIADVKPDSFDWKGGIYIQTKRDGMYNSCDVFENGVVFKSRQGKEMPQDCLDMQILAETILMCIPAGYKLTGEFVVQERVDQNWHDLPREISNGIMNSVQQGGVIDNRTQRISYTVWDIVSLEKLNTLGLDDTPYEKRLALLQQCMIEAAGEFILIDSPLVFSLAEAYQHCAGELAKGREGSIFKAKHMPWKDHTSKLQVKLKLEFEVELKVVGFVPGKGKLKDLFGSLMCESSDGLLAVDVSGLEDELRAQIHNNRNDWLNSIITVRANGITSPTGKKKTYSLYLPRYVERRYDKVEADSLQRIQEQMKSAIEVLSQVGASK